MKVMSLAGAIAAITCCLVACGAATEGSSPDVELDGVTPLGQVGCNKHVDCNDGNPCTVDTCVRGMGCRHTIAPTGTPCDDGNGCTANDACSGASCAGEAVVCAAAAADQCHATATCDPTTGACPVIAPARADGVACNDGNACTAQETCNQGACGTPRAGSYTFVEVFPHADYMSVSGINSYGDVVGSYQRAADGWAVRGFVFHAGVYTTLENCPGANETSFNAIDDAGRLLGVCGSHPFVYANGVFTPIDGLDAVLAMDWNPAGDITGITGQAGFVFRGGVLTRLALPGADITGATGISSNGDIVAYSLNVGPGGATTNPRSHIIRDGVFTQIAVPGALMTYAYGIRDGAVAGWTRSADERDHAFVYRNAAFTLIDVPGAFATYGRGINATGQVVGTFEWGGITKGFIATPTANSCTAP